MNALKFGKLVAAIFIVGSSASAIADTWSCQIGIYNGQGDTELLARENLQATCTLENGGDDQGCIILANGANCSDTDDSSNANPAGAYGKLP